MWGRGHSNVSPRALVGQEMTDFVCLRNVSTRSSGDYRECFKLDCFIRYLGTWPRLGVGLRFDEISPHYPDPQDYLSCLHVLAYSDSGNGHTEVWLKPRRRHSFSFETSGVGRNPIACELLPTLPKQEQFEGFQTELVCVSLQLEGPAIHKR